MGQTEQAYNWTTLDELNCVRSYYLGRSYRYKQEHQKIELDERIRLIRNYIRVARQRDWTGLGVMVDPAMVILQAMDYLEELLIERRHRQHGQPEFGPVRQRDTVYHKSVNYRSRISRARGRGGRFS